MRSAIKYLLSALLLLASSFSHASIVYQQGGFYNTPGNFASSASLCMAILEYHNANSSPAGTFTSSSDTNCYFHHPSIPMNTTRNVSKTTGICPDPTSDDGSGNCVEAPQYSCDSNRAMFATVTKRPDGTFPDTLCAAQSAGGDDYCMYGNDTVNISPNNMMSVLFKTASELPLPCEIPDDVDQITRLPFAPDSFTGQMTEQDTRIVESNEDFSPPETFCVANGDGTDTCTTITTTVKDFMAGKGTTTTSDGTTASTTSHDGNNTHTTNTETTVDDGNGTTTSTNQKTVSNTTGGSQTQNFDSSTGSTVDTTVPSGSTQTSTTTTTTITNPDGTTSTTSTTDSATTPTDSATEGNCGATGQPACVITFEGQDGLGDPTDFINNSGINGQFDGFIEEIGNIGNDDISDKTLSNPFTLPPTGTCDPASYNVDYHGTNMNMMTSFCEAYDSTLHPILRYFVYGITIIFLYRVYLSTTTRT